MQRRFGRGAKNDASAALRDEALQRRDSRAPRDQRVFVRDRGAEDRRIVGIDRDRARRSRRAACNGCSTSSGHDAGARVRRGRDFERNRRVRAGARRRAGSSSARTPCPMRSAPISTAAADALRAGGFAGVGDGVQALRARKREDVGKELGRKVRFIAAEADADDAIARERRGKLRRAHRRVGAKVARHVDDKRELDAIGCAPRAVRQRSRESSRARSSSR